MKQLVITADDFGLAEPIDRGIREVCEKGIVTNVSLVANGENIKSAARFVEEHPRLSAAVHLNLTDGAPLSGHGGLRPLLNSSGHFLGNHWKAAWKCLGVSNKSRVRRENGDGSIFLGKNRTVPIFHPPTLRWWDKGEGALLEGVETEYRAQIQRVLDCGVKISQLNTHGHLHAIPTVFLIVVKLAAEFKIPCVRVVRERPPAAGWMSSPAAYCKTVLLNKLFSYSELISLAGSAQTQRCAGLFDSGRLTLDRFKKMLAALPEGRTEILCHPGYGEEGVRQKYRWGYRWDEERKLLLSEALGECLRNYR